MDDDTIFPAFANGEHIIGKYTNSMCCANIRLNVILTNHRLLVRRDYSLFGCFATVRYTSITLESIKRADEEPAKALLKFIMIMSALLVISILLLIFGIVTGFIFLIIVAALMFVLSILVVILRYILENDYYVYLCGTFGGESLKLSKQAARELEGKLLEMSYQRQYSPLDQGPTKSGQAPVPPAASSSSSTPLPYQSSAYLVASGHDHFNN